MVKISESNRIFISRVNDLLISFLIYFNILFDIASYPELDLFSTLSIIVIVSSSDIFLSMHANADGVSKYCVYVSVWSLEMVKAKKNQIFGKWLLNIFVMFQNWLSFFLLSTIQVGNLLRFLPLLNVSFIILFSTSSS